MALYCVTVASVTESDFSCIPSYVMRSERSGLGLAPFDPDHNSTALLVDEDLYAGTVADLSGVDPIIFR